MFNDYLNRDLQRLINNTFNEGEINKTQNNENVLKFNHS